MSPIILIYKVFSIFHPYLSLNPLKINMTVVPFFFTFVNVIASSLWTSLESREAITFIWRICILVQTNEPRLLVQLASARQGSVGAFIEVFTLHTVSVVSFVTRALVWTISIGTWGEGGMTSVVPTDTSIIISTGFSITAVSGVTCIAWDPAMLSQAALSS